MIAEALLETVAARAADTESQRRLPADLAAALAHAGLFRMLVPKSLDGAEADVATLFTALEQLGRADAATGWCVMIGGTTALISAWLPAEYAREIWADPHVITGGVFAPMGRAAVDGGDYVVTGRWPWGSGSANCSWLLGGAVIMDGAEMRRLPSGAPDHRMMVMRKAEVELIDTWDALGLRGTGSGDLAASNVRLPQGRSVSFITDTPRETGALYRFAPFGLLALGIAAVASGNALGALDDLQALAVAKKAQGSSRSLAERGVVQADFAVAHADLAAARALVQAEIAAAWDLVVAGDTLDLP
ncbi:acyl-CoA dehydrogenase family protein, partial [Sandarakinorhabdus sp.]|uniref:acyl-CoA dehydrogenase family protein n=1 Tax=Sandarakinorhabdus sp. TaxID=1916663 RepID=UPI0035615EA9